MSRGWFLPICLIALLSTSGWAWGQVGKTLQEESEKPFLKPYSPETKNQSNQSLDASFKTNTTETNKRIGITPNKPTRTATQKSSKPSFGRYQKSEIKPDNPKIGMAGSSMSFQGYNQYNPMGLGSFLDGYLLKSLQEKRIGKKKAEDESSSDETLLKKKKGSFMK